jgi:pimeloyl-ACP methyl ester carboxylesterase
MPILETRLAVGPMSYRQEGADGPTLLQVHGLGTGHRNFDLLTPKLASRFKVIDVDLPGYGTTTPLAGEPSIAGLAQRVADFIEGMALAPVLVHGTSMGGLVAMTLAAERPELVDRLVVTCSFARHDNAMSTMRESWLEAADASPRLLAIVTSVQGFSRGFWDRSDAREIQQAFIEALETGTTDAFIRDIPMMESLDLSDVVTRIKSPTLLLGASEDQMTPLQTAPSGLGMIDLARLIPKAELKVLPDCGHFISIERGAETADEIAAFFLGGAVEEGP